MLVCLFSFKKSLELITGRADDDEEEEQDSKNNSCSSDLSASERGDSLMGSIHSCSSSILSPAKPRETFRDMFIVSPHRMSPGENSSRRISYNRSLSKQRISALPLTMEESSNGEDHIVDDDGGEDETGSFEFDKLQQTDGSHHHGDAYAAMAEFENMGSTQFDTSEYFEALEDEYYEALEKNTRKPPSITFVEENDLIVDNVRHTSNMDIFDEGIDYPFGGQGGPLFAYNDDDDDESISEDMMGDEDSMDDSDDEEVKKIRRGILFGAGGAAAMAGLGYVAKRIMYGIQNSDDVDGGYGGTEMFNPNGTDHTVTMTETGADVAHAAELAADVSTASMNSSASEGLVATTAVNAQGAAGGAAQ